MKKIKPSTIVVVDVVKINNYLDICKNAKQNNLLRVNYELKFKVNEK